MGIDTDIRQIAREAAREVLREELQQIQGAIEGRRPTRLPPEPLLSVESVAKLCGVAPRTVQRWISRGLLRAMRGPGMREYRITQRDYEAFATGTADAGPAGRRPVPLDVDLEAARTVAAALSPRRTGR